MQQAQFHIEVSKVHLSEDQRFIRYIWTDGYGDKHVVIDPLDEVGEDRYRTRLPILAFSEIGCDITGQYDPASYNLGRLMTRMSGLDFGDTAKVPTPQLPGVLSIRSTEDLAIRLGAVPKDELILKPTKASQKSRSDKTRLMLFTLISILVFGGAGWYLRAKKKKVKHNDQFLRL